MQDLTPNCFKGRADFIWVGWEEVAFEPTSPSSQDDASRYFDHPSSLALLMDLGIA